MTAFDDFRRDVESTVSVDDIVEKILHTVKGGFERKSRKPYVEGSLDYVEIMRRLGLVGPTPEEFGRIRPIPGFPLTKKARELYEQVRAEGFYDLPD